MDWSNWVFLAVIVLFVLGAAYALYGRRGTQISEHPQGRRRGTGQAGAEGSGERTGRDEGERTELDTHGTKP